MKKKAMSNYQDAATLLLRVHDEDSFERLRYRLQNEHDDHSGHPSHESTPVGFATEAEGMRPRTIHQVYMT